MSIFVENLEIPDVKVIHVPKHGDQRGFFSETYHARKFADAGIRVDFVQDNHAFSMRKGTLRGLHFQIPPFAQAKLVRVTRGAIFDVAVDVRVGSPSFGRHVSAIISADSWNQIFVPVGFAHGLVTLEPDTDVLYKVSNIYAPERDKGLRWNDPALGIKWPISGSEAILSERDRRQPVLADLPVYFQYDTKDQL